MPVMTIVTVLTLKEGDEPEWDGIMRERLEAARGQPGWVAGQIAIPVDRLDQRAIMGTWETRAHWEAWHDDPAFAGTRERLEGLQEQGSETRWFEVIERLQP